MLFRSFFCLLSKTLIILKMFFIFLIDVLLKSTFCFCTCSRECFFIFYEFCKSFFFSQFPEQHTWSLFCLINKSQCLSDFMHYFKTCVSLVEKSKICFHSSFAFLSSLMYLQSKFLFSLSLEAIF